MGWVTKFLSTLVGGAKNVGGFTMGLRRMLNSMTSNISKNKKPANNILNTNNFFGRRSQSSPGDDAPNVFMPDPLMGLYTDTILPESTVIPSFDSFQGIAPGVQGIVAEIYRINRNIDAIRNAMMETAGIEGGYRKKLIDDMQDDLAERGKKRSGRRSDRGKWNRLSRFGQLKRNVATAVKSPWAQGAGLLGLEAINWLSGGARNNTDTKGDGKGNTGGNDDKDNNSGGKLPPLTKEERKKLLKMGFTIEGIEQKLAEPNGRKQLQDILETGQVQSNLTPSKGAMNNIASGGWNVNNFMGSEVAQLASEGNLSGLLGGTNFTDGDIVNSMETFAGTVGDVFLGVERQLDMKLGGQGSLRKMIIDLTNKVRTSDSDGDSGTGTIVTNIIPNKSVSPGRWQGYLASGER